ncbi:MAG TPA: hypothetical protein VGF13_02060 [Verrucomicrobiae bacterium]|jgi:hypothetical protein
MSTIYKDKLIEVTEEGVTFRNYYFPFGDRSIPFDQIERVEVGPSSVLDGGWRLWGTGDFRTWFPLDMKRPRRDRIFVASLRESSRRIGFTVEDAPQVERVLRERGLLREKSPA